MALSFLCSFFSLSPNWSNTSSIIIFFVILLFSVSYYLGLTFISKQSPLSQIRIHLAHIGCPIINDEVYGQGGLPPSLLFSSSSPPSISSDSLPSFLEHRHFLHSLSLSLSHPLTGQPLTVEAPLPKDFEDLMAHMDKLEEHTPMNNNDNNK